MRRNGWLLVSRKKIFIAENALPILQQILENIVLLKSMICLGNNRSKSLDPSKPSIFLHSICTFFWTFIPFSWNAGFVDAGRLLSASTSVQTAALLSLEFYQVSRTWNCNGEKCLILLKGSSDFLSKIYYFARRKVRWILSPNANANRVMRTLSPHKLERKSDDKYSSRINRAGEYTGDGEYTVIEDQNIRFAEQLVQHKERWYGIAPLVELAQS